MAMPSHSPALFIPEPVMTTIDAELDTSGLDCPLPILKAKKALASLRGGQVLRVVATDPDSVRDFEAFSRQLGHALLETREDGGRYYFLLRKRED
jgi:tRNA 2-thiouridine synthesizing protein A